MQLGLGIIFKPKCRTYLKGKLKISKLFNRFETAWKNDKWSHLVHIRERISEQLQVVHSARVLLVYECVLRRLWSTLEKREISILPYKIMNSIRQRVSFPPGKPLVPLIPQLSLPSCLSSIPYPFPNLITPISSAVIVFNFQLIETSEDHNWLNSKATGNPVISLIYLLLSTWLGKDNG